MLLVLLPIDNVDAILLFDLTDLKLQSVSLCLRCTYVESRDIDSYLLFPTLIFPSYCFVDCCHIGLNFCEKFLTLLFCYPHASGYAVQQAVWLLNRKRSGALAKSSGNLSSKAHSFLPLVFVGYQYFPGGRVMVIQFTK